MAVLDIPEITTLVEILESIDRFLSWIVESSVMPAAMRMQFIQNYGLIRERIKLAVLELQAVSDPQQELFRRLEFFGLTGPQLELKFNLATSVSERAIASAVNGAVDGRPRIFGRALKPVLQWINLILGSLSKALPILDVVKEYKEGVELTVEDQHDAPLPDRRMFPGIR